MNFSPSSVPSSAPAASTGQALAPRTRLAEFEIERVLHESSFSIVYLATDLTLECPVALKELFPSALVSRAPDGSVVLRSQAHAETFARGKRAFLAEARLLAHGNHPSLVHVSRIVEANGTAYRVMPYYPGKSLLALRQAMDEPPDEATLRALLDGLLGALETVHRMGHVHREVSPGNILLLPDDRPVLLDSGTVRRSMISDQAQTLMAGLERSFSFVDSDAAASDSLPGPWTDLHALAAVLHFCISGDLPGSTSLLAASVRREPLAEIIRKRGLHYSAPFIRTLSAALSPNPQDRPQSVAEFRASLDARVEAPAVAMAPSDVQGQIPTLNHAFTSPSGPGAMQPAQSERTATGKADSSPASRTAEPSAHPASWVEPSLNRPDTEWQTTTVLEPHLLPDAPAFKPAASPASRPAEPAPPQSASLHDEPSTFGTDDSKVMASLERLVAATAREEANRRRRKNWAVGSAVVTLVVAVGLGGWRLHEDQKIDATLAQAARMVTQSEANTGADNAPPVADPALPPAEVSETQASAPPSGDDISTLMEAPPSAGPLPDGAAPAPIAPPAISPAIPSAEPPITTPTAQGMPSESVLASDDAALMPPQVMPANPPPVAVKPATVPPEPVPTSPRQVCGNRTQFSLYNCMQTQCDRKQWTQHAQCKRFRITDTVE